MITGPVCGSHSTHQSSSRASPRCPRTSLGTHTLIQHSLDIHCRRHTQFPVHSDLPYTQAHYPPSNKHEAPLATNTHIACLVIKTPISLILTTTSQVKAPAQGQTFPHPHCVLSNFRPYLPPTFPFVHKTRRPPACLPAICRSVLMSGAIS